MARYGYFEDTKEPQITVTTTFDRKQFGELETIGTVMQYRESSQDFWERTGIGGSITSKPDFWRDFVFFGACDKNFYCLDSMGREVWRFRANGMIMCDAAVSDGIVYFGSKDHNVYALNCQTGQLLWRFPTAGPILDRVLVHQGIVYAGSYRPNVYALDARTGRELWRIPTIGGQAGAFAKDNVLYFGFQGNTFQAYDIGTRKLLWIFRTQKEAGGWNGCFWGNNVYIGSYEGNIYALDRTTGRLVWKFSTGNVVNPPILGGDLLYAGSWDNYVYCLDAGTGRLVWKFRTNGINVRPVVEGGKVYIGSWDNNVYCIDALSGREIWRFSTNGFVSYVNVLDGRLYFGSWDCNFYCVDAETGKLIWKFRTSLGTPSQIEPPETGIVRSAEIIWQATEEAKDKEKQPEAQFSDYAETKTEYAGMDMGDYLRKKKRGYV
jgi:outer membrane protein assembly factor BamB